MRLPSLIAAAIALTLAPAIGSAQSGKPPQPPGYFEDSSRGWHFYEIPPPEPEPEPEPVVPPGGAGEGAAPPLSTAWIRENLPRIRDQAIDNPTRENVETFALLQRLSMDMAERFAGVMQVVSQDPAIDEYARSPITALQRAAADEVQSQASTAVMNKIAQKTGLWYFYRSDCPYCAAQDPVLKRFSETSGLEVLPISLDGLPLPSGLFPNYVNDSGQAAELRVTSTPTLVLAHPETNKLYTVGAGLKTRPELTERIVQIAYAEGWITDEEYALATRGQERSLMALGSDELPADLADNPSLLLQQLRSMTSSARATGNIPETP